MHFEITHYKGSHKAIYVNHHAILKKKKIEAEMTSEYQLHDHHDTAPFTALAIISIHLPPKQ
jgi:hypothetical protein